MTAGPRSSPPGSITLPDAPAGRTAAVAAGVPAPPGLGAALTDLALSGAGWEGILAQLAAVAQRPVRLLGVHGAVLAASDGSTAGIDADRMGALLDRTSAQRVRCSDAQAGVGLAVRAGSRQVGLLVLAAPADEPVDACADLLRAALTAVAIEAVRRDAEAAARSESAARLVEELRFGSPREPAELLAAAGRFGLDLHARHAAVVFAYDGPNQRTWTTGLSWIEYPTRQDADRGWTVIDAVGPRTIPAEVSRIRTRLQGMVGRDRPVLAAVGPVVGGAGIDLSETAASLREAAVVLGLLRRRPGQTELAHAELGLASMLIGSPPSRLEAFVSAELGPLLDRPELLITLSAWLDTDGSRHQVAERIHVHRNSVGYRMARVKESLGVETLTPEKSRTLHAAIAALEVLNALGERQPIGAPVNPRP